MGGERVAARAVVVATEGPEASRLLGQPAPRQPRACTCVYFAAETAPIDEAILMLDGDRSGPVNNLAVMSNVSASYAPAGASLVAATIVGTASEPDDRLIPAVRHQMRRWFAPRASPGGRLDAQTWHLIPFRVLRAFSTTL